MAKQPFRPISVSKPELKAIYQAIGQRDGLERILKDFYGRMSKDILIGYFFDGKNTDDIARMQSRFLMKAMGATDSYSGKAPADAHTELPQILAGHFDRRLRILEETLRDHGLTEAQIKVWIDFESAFRAAIVAKT